jgi:hypothetical protein
VYSAGAHRNGGLGGSDRLSRCPSCLRPVAVYEEWVEVNGSLVHASCARQGEYEELPSPGWTEAEELARTRWVP